MRFQILLSNGKKVSVSSFAPDSPLFFLLNVRFLPFLLLPLSPCTRVQLATAGELIIAGIVIIIIIVIGVSRSTLLKRPPANTAAALIAGSTQRH